MEIRRLGPGDEAVAEAACRVFGDVGPLNAGRFLASARHILLVAEEGEEVIGWVYGHELIHPDGEATTLLYALDVVERARRRGAGAALVAAFVHEARLADCTEVWVLTDDSNPAALATYRSAGGVRDAVPQVMFSWRLAERRHS